jgi:predicted house-cleaning NTP pyrophosphatase (Maf/HAM1 superfamily)
VEGADTVVTVDGLIYGKPADEREAQAGFPFTFQSSRIRIAF